MSERAFCQGISLTPEQQFFYAKRLRRKIRQNSNNCWEFTGHRDSLGYGKTSVRAPHKRTVLAHRLSYAATFGHLPSGLLACHRCDNPCCINPLHLFLGTNHQNTMDSVKKGRHVHPVNDSEKVWCCKLTKNQVHEIRRLCQEKQLSQKQIANLFSVSQSTVSTIHTHSKWKRI